MLLEFSQALFAHVQLRYLYGKPPLGLFENMGENAYQTQVRETFMYIEAHFLSSFYRSINIAFRIFLIKHAYGDDKQE